MFVVFISHWLFFHAWGYHSLGVFYAKLIYNDFDVPWATIPDGEEGAVGTLPLVACPLDTSRARALRAVEFPYLEDKAQAIILAQEWRAWDVSQISRQPGTTGLEGTVVGDVHMRLCA